MPSSTSCTMLYNLHLYLIARPNWPLNWSAAFLAVATQTAITKMSPSHQHFNFRPKPLCSKKWSNSTDYGHTVCEDVSRHVRVTALNMCNRLFNANVINLYEAHKRKYLYSNAWYWNVRYKALSCFMVNLHVSYHIQCLCSTFICQYFKEPHSKGTCFNFPFLKNV